MDDQRTDRKRGRIVRVCRAILSVIAVLGVLNPIALMIHQSLIGGMTGGSVNGKYFVWDKGVTNMYTKVSERRYKLLDLHEMSAPLGMLSALIAIGILTRLTGDGKNKNPTT